MAKSRFFQMILRLLSWSENRKKEIHFLSMVVFITIALSIGIRIFFIYRRDPMFANPETIVEHLASPLFISMFTITVILLFGVFFSSVVLMSPFKRLAFFNVEMEFQDKAEKELIVANQFTFISTMLNNNSSTIKEMLNDNLTELTDVVEKLSLSYKRFVNEYNKGVSLEVDVLKENEIESAQEKKLLEDVKRSEHMSNTYLNRILNGNNVMVGVVKGSEEVDNVVIIARSNYDYPFDHYDMESMASIIEYSLILYEMINMITLLPEPNEENLES
ncbi:hypothetical protein CR194_19160 [Salipaludibacillus keqinensis]|uniref:Uncharacterized protein n=1 Tax=Salipaludibacillus keqinensis TaxID=2045207 RepID=A0A323T5S0_9BACI|nr:hypothetical protein [Salipaludibacillus keqinensis]PYZ91742.1 hypothetical protein CR194_19160 [Salipaludibacillus keqinensis]